MSAWEPKVLWLDRYDRVQGYLPVLGDVRHAEALEGEDTLTFTSTVEPEKGDRLFAYFDEEPHEFAVCAIDRTSEGAVRVEAEGALFKDLRHDYLFYSLFLRNQPAEDVLMQILMRTPWTRGTVDDTKLANIDLYRISRLEALWRFATTWGLEPVPHSRISAEGAISRTLDMRRERGEHRTLRIEEQKNLLSIMKSVLATDVYSALKGLGVSLPNVDDEGNWTGGYKRRLEFNEVLGHTWGTVEDEEATKTWGIFQGAWQGGEPVMLPSTGEVIFPTIDDKVELLDATEEALQKIERPALSYRVIVPSMGDALGLGDYVQTIAPSVGLDAMLRVIRRVRYPSEGYEELTLNRPKPQASTDISTFAESAAPIASLLEDLDSGTDPFSQRLMEVPTREEVAGTVQTTVEDDLGQAFSDTYIGLTDLAEVSF